MITDSEGNKFELVPMRELKTVVDTKNNSTHTEGYALRPIPPKPKWEVRLKSFDNNVMDYNFVIDAFVNVSEDQAQPIKDKIEKLVKEHFDE